ncbi:protein of unknown function DUF4379 [Sporosarcina phage Lietuvens]|nr:protein of unknown function DUF4379 [Sporosarcina phage Lietuvens]
MNMILDKTVEIPWSNRSRQHFVDKGYKYTRTGERFEVKVGDLQRGSEVAVACSCDYCGKRIEKPYKKLLISRELVAKDSCESIPCLKLKRADTRAAKFRGSLVLKYPEIAKQFSKDLNKYPVEKYHFHSNEKVWWSCEKGHTWEASIEKRTKYGRGCHYCAGRKVDETNSLKVMRPDMLQEWDFSKNTEVSPEEITACSGISVWWVCADGHTWKSKVSNRYNGSKCPMCQASSGEYRVREFLESEKVRFVEEYSFEGLVGLRGGILRFDFAIQSESGEVLGLVEFDGEFHYRKVFSEGAYERIKAHDKIKDEYCEREGIPLKRIPYTRYERLEEELEDFLHKIGGHSK